MKRFLASIALMIGLVGAAVPATAVSWGPTSSSYNGSRRVTGWGDFYNSGNTYARSKMVTRDDRNDGNTVYGRTEYSFYGYRCVSGECSTRWFSSGTKTTPEFANSTRTYWLDKGLYGLGDKARGKTFACAQMGWPVPDSCSSASYPSFGY